MDKVSTFSKLFLKVTKVARKDIPAGEGPPDEIGFRPAQTEYACFIDGVEGRKFVVAIYAINSKVIMIMPFEDSGLCTDCYLMNIQNDNQASMNRLLSLLLLNADEIEDLCPEDEEICEESEPMTCPECRIAFQTNKPVEIPAHLLN